MKPRNNRGEEQRLRYVMTSEHVIKVFVPPAVIRGNPKGAVESIQYSVIEAIRSFDIEIEHVQLSTARDRNISTILKISKDIWFLCRPGKTTKILFFYPAIPLVPTTSNLKFVVASLVYSYLFHMMKKKNIPIITLVLDLPVEQERLLGVRAIKTNPFLYKRFERRIFNNSSFILTASPWFEQQVYKGSDVKRKSIMRYERSPYYVDYKKGAQRGLEEEMQRIIVQHSPIAFYSGDLRRNNERIWVERVIKVFQSARIKERTPAFIVCGAGGEWIEEMKCSNTYYLGYLDKASHDYVAKKASFGLMVYPNRGYYKYTPTTKYSAYIANGLPILSIESETITSSLKVDGTGESVGEEHFEETLIAWLNNSELFTRYLQPVKDKSAWFRDHGPVKEWLNDVLEERGN